MQITPLALAVSYQYPKLAGYLIKAGAPLAELDRDDAHAQLSKLMPGWPTHHPSLPPPPTTTHRRHPFTPSSAN